MAELKTDYKDQLLDSLVNTKRVYNLVDTDGNVVRENVSLEDVTVYSQNGDNFGAADINKTNEEVNQLNRKLTNENAETFNFGVKDGVRGFYTNPSRADDCFVPFKSTKNLGNYTGTQTIPCTSLPNYALLTNDDFIVEITNVTLKTYPGNSNINYPEYLMEKSYDASTGTLTVIGEYNAYSRGGEIYSITYNVWVK